jgi:hypothetical protein
MESHPLTSKPCNNFAAFSTPLVSDVVDLAGVREYSARQVEANNPTRKTMAKYLQCSECGKLAFYYDDFVGTEKPFYKRFMRYPEGETKHEPPRCFSCGGVPRMIHDNIKEEKAAAAKH